MSRTPIKRRRKPSLRSQIDAIAELMEPRIRDAFLNAVQGVKDTTLLSEVVKAIEAGDPSRAFAALGFNDAALRPITNMIDRTFEQGGLATVGTFPALATAEGARAAFRFDVRNSRAEAWLRDQSSALVTRVTQETRVGIMNVMQGGMERGSNPRDTALDIVGRVDPQTGRRTGGIIGLSGPQERYVANAKRELADPVTASNWFTRTRRDKRFDGIVRRSIKDGVALDSATINRLTTRYSDSLLKLRGDTIARTETIAALNRSSHEAFAQAVDTGAIPGQAVKRVWDSAGHDGRTRSDHLQMDGQTVGMNEPFRAPDGSLLMFPGDQSLGAPPEQTINCRCRVRMAVDWLAAADAS